MQRVNQLLDSTNGTCRAQLQCQEPLVSQASSSPESPDQTIVLHSNFTSLAFRGAPQRAVRMPYAICLQCCQSASTRPETLRGHLMIYCNAIELTHQA